METIINYDLHLHSGLAVNEPSSQGDSWILENKENLIAKLILS